MPSSVSIFSVTKFLPGEVMFTVALVIFIALLMRAYRSYFNVIQRCRFVAVRLAFNLQLIARPQRNNRNRIARRGIPVHLIDRQSIVGLPIRNRLVIEVSRVSGNSVKVVEVLNCDAVSSGGLVQRDFGGALGLMTRDRLVARSRFPRSNIYRCIPDQPHGFRFDAVAIVAYA